MIIKPDNEMLSYSGRIDFDDRLAPVLVYACSSIGMKFTGTSLKAVIANHRSCWTNELGYFIDGEQKRFTLSSDEEKKTYTLAEGLSEGTHELLLFKRMDSCHTFTFYGFEIDDGAKVLPLPEKPKRKMEFFGDSVSCGEVSEAVAYVGKPDPEHDGEYSNSWYSYAWIAARKLDAQLHDIAQGGVALLDNTGWYHEPDYIGMEQVWNKMRYNPDYGTVKEWDFSKYTPDIVIVAIGQNDSHPDDYMKTDYEGEKAKNWRTHYRQFLAKLRVTYPDAWIICCTTLLQHDIGWDMSISQAVLDIADKKISHCVFQRNGKATPGHLRIPEAEEMAEELCHYIHSLNIEGY